MIDISWCKWFLTALLAILVLGDSNGQSKTVIKTIQLGKETGTIGDGAFSVSTIKSFRTLLPENQLDMTLVVRRTSPDSSYYWPQIMIDSILYGEKELFYTNFSKYRNYHNAIRDRASRTVLPLAHGDDVYLFGLFLFLNPVELQDGNFGFNRKSDFVPGIIKSGNFRIFTTVFTTSSSQASRVIKESVCFQVQVGTSDLSAIDIGIVKTFQERFARLTRLRNHSNLLPSKELLPLQDTSFIDSLKSFAHKSSAHRKIVGTICSGGYLRQYLNKEFFSGPAEDVFEKNDLFFTFYSEIMKETYNSDRLSGIVLLTEGPVPANVSLPLLGLELVKSLWRGVIPSSFLTR